MKALRCWGGDGADALERAVSRYSTPFAPCATASDDVAHAIMVAAGAEVASLARALDPSGTLPMALCGGLGASLRAYLPAELLARCVPAQGDAASGALRMIAQHVRRG